MAYKINPDLCVACGTCIDECPVEAISAGDVYVFEESLAKAVKGNPHLYTGFKYIQYHPMVLMAGLMKRVLPRKLRFAILTNRMPHKLFWAFFKAATILHAKIRLKVLLRQAKWDKNLERLLSYVNRGGKMAAPTGS